MKEKNIEKTGHIIRIVIFLLAVSQLYFVFEVKNISKEMFVLTLKSTIIIIFLLMSLLLYLDQQIDKHFKLLVFILGFCLLAFSLVVHKVSQSIINGIITLLTYCVMRVVFLKDLKIVIRVIFVVLSIIGIIYILIDK